MKITDTIPWFAEAMIEAQGAVSDQIGVEANWVDA